ncbi:MAG: diaminopimelate decarboxylase [Candidatus Kapaibacterium sp.]
MNETTFLYSDIAGQPNLFCEDSLLAELAEKYGTPLYVYSTSQILKNYRSFDEAINKTSKKNSVSYAIKANSNLEILKLLASNGAGASVVSGGELIAALKAGFDLNRITFDGPGKTDDEITLAINSNIFAIDIESLEELFVVNQIAESLGRNAPISIRVNPHVDAKTHPYISTGLSQNKFGIPFEKAFEAYRSAATLSNIEIVGLHSHIGSQITELAPFIEAAESISQFVMDLRKREGIDIKHINVGGGEGISYHNVVTNPLLPKDEAVCAIPAIEEFVSSVVSILSRTGCTISTEPGRAIVANACALITKVLYTKSNGEKHFVIVDAGMNDLMRPSLYQAYHEIVPLLLKGKKEFIKADIVGPICETGDFLALNRTTLKMSRGDMMAVLCTGAYGYVLASNYNLRPRAAEVLVEGKSSRIIRNRERVEDIIG